MRRVSLLACVIVMAGAACVSLAQAQDINDIARQLSNPLANLARVPFQNDFDYGAGRNHAGLSYTLSLQPMIPISLNRDWLLITHSYIPATVFNGVLPATEAGLGDVTQTFYLSPAASVAGVTWGLGPIVHYPTDSNRFTGNQQWAAGPAAIALYQGGPWTVGVSANHLWRFAGNDDNNPMNRTFVQPFATYGFGRGLTITLSAESLYDWTATQWTVPIVADVSQVFKLGDQLMSFGLSGIWFAVRPDTGSEFGMRARWTLIFPQ